MMTPVTAKPVQVCSYCLYPLGEGETVMLCPDCKTPHHSDCWQELGGCTTYGCPRMVQTEKAEPGITIWGANEKKCPACAENIPAAAMKCPYCKTVFDDVRPIAREDLLKTEEDPAAALYRKRAIALLILSVLGVTSPIALVIGVIWYRARKREIKEAGPTVQALVVISLVVSTAYVGLIGLGFVIFKLFQVAREVAGTA